MNFIDIILVIPLLWFAYRGFQKGLVLEVFSLLAFFAGIYAAIHFSNFASDLLSENFNMESEYLPVISFALTFLAVVVLVNVLGRMISKFIKAIALGPINKILGGLFSVLKMVLIMGFLLGLINTMNEKFEFLDDSTKESSLLYQPLISSSEKILPAIKESRYYEQFEKWQEEKED